MVERELTLVAEGFSFTEGPRWHDGRLWFSDFYTHTVNAVDGSGDIETIATVPAQPSGLGWLPDGSLLIVSMKDQRVLRRTDDGTLAEYADISRFCGGHANDMVVAENGQAYVGNFGFDRMAGDDHAFTNLVLVDVDGSSRVVAEGLSFPNGSVITPDGGTLIVGESYGNRLSAFDILADGSLGERRDWASFGDLGDEPDMVKRAAAASFSPDGSSLDADGAIWVADARRQVALRLAEGGEILDRVETTPANVFAVALGGEDGRTLFLCTAPDSEQASRSAAREARILSTRVDVPHAGRP